MKDLISNVVYGLALAFIIAATFLMPVGCATAPAVIQMPATPQAALTKIVTTTNWLATLGILVSAAGVYAFFTGNSKAEALIAAGVTIGGGVIAFAMMSQLAETWTRYALWVLPALGAAAVGIYAWGHWTDTKNAAGYTALKNAVVAGGDVTMVDVKRVLGIK